MCHDWVVFTMLCLSCFLRKVKARYGWCDSISVNIVLIPIDDVSCELCNSIISLCWCDTVGWVIERHPVSKNCVPAVLEGSFFGGPNLGGNRWKNRQVKQKVKVIVLVVVVLLVGCSHRHPSILHVYIDHFLAIRTLRPQIYPTFQQN